MVELLNFSRGDSRHPSSQVIINIKEQCAIPASNTFKTENEIDPISSFTATGMTDVLLVTAERYSQVISKLL